MGYHNSYGNGPLSGAFIPRIRTYNEAYKRYQDTKPIRGSNPEIRPLGARRYKHLELRMDKDENIECVLYGSPCVTFLKQTDTILLKHNGWVTPSTAAFIDKILPSNYGTVYIDRGKMIFVEANAHARSSLEFAQYPVTDKYIIGSTDPLVINLNTLSSVFNSNHGGTHILTVEGEHYCNWHMDKKEWHKVCKEVTQTIAPFMDYCRTLNAMRQYDNGDMRRVGLEVLGIPPDTPASELPNIVPELRKLFEGSDHPYWSRQITEDYLIEHFVMAICHRAHSIRMSQIHRANTATLGYLTKQPFNGLPAILENDSAQLGMNANKLLQMMQGNDPTEWLKAHIITIFSGPRGIAYAWPDLRGVAPELAKCRNDNMYELLEEMIKVCYADRIFKPAENEAKNSRNQNFIFVNAFTEYKKVQNKSTAMSMCGSSEVSSSEVSN